MKIIIDNLKAQIESLTHSINECTNDPISPCEYLDLPGTVKRSLRIRVYMQALQIAERVETKDEFVKNCRMTASAYTRNPLNSTCPLQNIKKAWAAEIWTELVEEIKLLSKSSNE